MESESDSAESLPSSVGSSLHRCCIEGDAQTLSDLLAECNGDLSAALASLDAEGRLPIHNALLHANVACVKEIVAREREVPDYNGIPATHLSLALSGFDSYKSDCESCLSLLLDSADITKTDSMGRTILHLVCSANLLTSLQRLLKREGVDCRKTDREGLTAFQTAVDHDAAECLGELVQELGSEALEIVDPRGDTIIHRAVRRGMWKCASVLLDTFTPSVLDLPNQHGFSPRRVAYDSGFESQISTLESGSIPQCHWKNQTLVVTHALCSHHGELPSTYASMSDLIAYQLATQPENPLRYNVLLSQPHGALLTDEFADNLLWMWEPPPAPLADVLRVHEYEYVATLKATCEALDPALGAVCMDRDTMVSAHSYRASLTAAGAVLAAIDEVVSGRCRSAFCPVRPPGHHAGPMGKVEPDNRDDEGSTGFCLLNNVAIGAAYALSVLRKDVKKVAIVDFDVHHGNGTQAIVANLRPSKFKAETRKYGLRATVQAASYKPWLQDSDYEHVLFVSTHGFGGKFYPGSGTESTSTVEHPAGILNLPFSTGTTSTEFRRLYTSVAFPRVLSFKPDLILVSAGFDAHEKEEINDGFCALSEGDYAWLTEELTKVANATCSGRIVSVLEGGYVVSEGIASPFARSVAAHVRALMTATRERFGESLKRKHSGDPSPLSKHPKTEGNSPARY